MKNSFSANKMIADNNMGQTKIYAYKIMHRTNWSKFTYLL